MTPATVFRATGWFVLLAAGALFLDGVDRYSRLSRLQADLERSAGATAEPGPAAPDWRASAMPPPVDDSGALRRLDGMRSPVVFDPEVQNRVYAGDAASDDGGRTWRPLSPDERPSLAVDGPLPIVFTPDRRLVIDGQPVDAPGPVVALSRAADGAVYAATADAARFPLWFAPSPGERWRPIGGSGAVAAMAPGEPGTLYAAGRSFGRWRDGAWTWTPWPDRFEAKSLVAHPRAPLVAALGAERVAISRDGGATLRPLRLGDRRVRWVGMDPFDAERVLLSVDADVYALDLGRLR